MNKLTLLTNKEYTFVFDQYEFDLYEFQVTDNNLVPLNNFTNTWSTLSKKIYTGTVERRDGNVYIINTNRKVSQLKLTSEFTTEGIYYLQSLDKSQLIELNVLSNSDSPIHPEIEKFTVLFSDINELNPDLEMVNYFIDNWVPASLIPVQKKLN